MSSRRHDGGAASSTAGAAGNSLAPSRVRARALAASVLRDALASLVTAGHDAATQRAVAKRLGVSHTQMQRWCGDGDPAVTLGDVLAMGPSVAAAVLRGALAAVAPPPPPGAACPQAIALSAFQHVGDLAETARRAVADGVVTHEEWGAVDARLDAMEADIARARAAVRAARGGGR